MKNLVDLIPPAGYEASEAKPMMNLQSTPPAFSSRYAPAPAIRPGRGVNPLTKPTQFKVGIVNVRQGATPKRGDAFWELRYIDPDTGHEVKRRVSGLNQDEVKAMAEHLTRAAYAGRGYLAGQRKAPTIAEGISEALQLTGTLQSTLDERIRQAMKFVGWLADRFPAVKTWDQMRPVHLQTYAKDLERDGKAFDTVRLALAPVKLAWRHMVENHSELVKPLPKVRTAKAPRREIECLNAGELAVLLDWLKANAPDLWPIACLQGLAGLRVLEAAAVRVQDVDLVAGTVTITDTGKHKPKTSASWRTIPVCCEVLESIKAAMTAQRVRPASGELFVNERGNLWTKEALGHRWTRTLRRAARELDRPRLCAVPARKLRAAFTTMASRLGAPDRLVKAVMGHSAGDMMGDHYRRIELDELRAVSSLVDGWRMADKTASARKDSGNIPVSRIAEC